MKHWILYGAAIVGIALFGASSFRGTDIAQLAPVEVVWLTDRGGQVYMVTDTGDEGLGGNAQAALENMKASASGNVFLDTADYLIVEQGKEALLQQMYGLLRPSCMVCIAPKMPDLENVADFLTAHEPAATLRQLQAERLTLPLLLEQQGRYSWNGE